MSRAPFQVLVYPYRQLGDGDFAYALFRRADRGWWQGIAGGGEVGELPEQAARREAQEEAGIPGDRPLLELATVIPISVVHFRDSHLWGDDLYVIPEHCFGVSVTDMRVTLSSEHVEQRWLGYETAQSIIHFEGDRTALWELHSRLTGVGPRGLGGAWGRVS